MDKQNKIYIPLMHKVEVFHTCNSREESWLGRDSIRTSISLAVLAINLAKTAA